VIKYISTEKIRLLISIVNIHNHPSGRLKPSPADKSITQQLMKGSEFLNLRLLDHLIISEEGYFSFMDEGIFEQLNDKATIIVSAALLRE
jgi:DNA repair protein RadC